MKRLYAAIAIVLLLAGLAWLHVDRLDRLTGSLISSLEQVDTLLQSEDWSSARLTVQLVNEQWEANAFYLHVTLRHTDLDAIRSSLREVSAYLEEREDKAECTAATARLINQLELLLETELPTIKNLL